MLSCNAGDQSSIPGSRRSSRGGHHNHSSILSWRILWTEEAGRLQSMGHKESDTTEPLTLNLKLIESKKRIKIIVHDHVFS